MFNFQHSQITQDEFDKLAKQLIKYSSVYATSKFDVGKISSSIKICQNKQQIFMSDFEFKPIHKFFKITISSIKYLKNTNSDIISLHVYNKTPYQVTLPLGL